MQRLVSRVLQAAACLALLISLNINVQAADANGTWTWTTPGRNGGPERKSVLKLKTEGDKLTGTINGRQNQDDIKISEGKVTGDEVSFTVTREFNGNSMTQKYTGKVSGDSIKGKVTGKNRQGEDTTRDWEAKREKDEKK
jgi:hypothetical protein